MFSEKTENYITDAVAAEFLHAKEVYGTKYNSNHEAYGVLLEEVDEVKDNLSAIDNHLKALWQMVKADNNEGVRIELGLIASYAIDLAKEAVQVSAVAYKAKGFDHE